MRLDADALVVSWVRSMRVRNLSRRTLEAYTDSVKRLVDHAREHDHDPFSRRAIEEYLATVADTRAPATVSFRYRALQQWFKWLTDEDELDVDPMAKMKAPQVPEQPTFCPRLATPVVPQRTTWSSASCSICRGTKEQVTPLPWLHAAPFITTATFSKRQEGVVGAGWLWWWIDDTGCCFGTLTQAKRLPRDGRRWKINFGYQRGDQLDQLLQCADRFDLPAVYLLLCGGADFRKGLSASDRAELERWVRPRQGWRGTPNARGSCCSPRKAGGPGPSAATATAPTQPTGHRSDRDGTRAIPRTRGFLQWRLL
jgi:hypothetical protein